MLGYFFFYRFLSAFFFYSNIFLKIRQHEVDVTPSLQNTRNQACRISVQEMNMSRTLAYVAGGCLLCWIPALAFVLCMEALFSRDSSKNCTVNSHISFLSEQHNKSIHIRRQKLCFPRRISQTAVLVEVRRALKPILMRAENEVMARKQLKQSPFRIL